MPAAFADNAPSTHYERSSDNLLFLAKLQGGAPISIPPSSGQYKEKYINILAGTNMRGARFSRSALKRQQ